MQPCSDAAFSVDRNHLCLTRQEGVGGEEIQDRGKRLKISTSTKDAFGGSDFQSPPAKLHVAPLNRC